jgi:sec-independent protein translocase protein TatC
MSFWEHIEELRSIVMRIVWIFVVSFAITCVYVDQITELLLKPLRQALQINQSGIIVYHSIFEKAWVQVDVSLMWAIIISSPLWFYQIWRFIRPGLHPHEIRAVKPFMIFGWICFIAGMASGYFIMPYVINFLAKLGVQGVSANIILRGHISISKYTNDLRFYGNCD